MAKITLEERRKRIIELEEQKKKLLDDFEDKLKIQKKFIKSAERSLEDSAKYLLGGQLIKLLKEGSEDAKRILGTIDLSNLSESNKRNMAHIEKLINPEKVEEAPKEQEKPKKVKKPKTEKPSANPVQGDLMGQE